MSAAPREDLLAPAVEMLHCPTLLSWDGDGRGGWMDGWTVEEEIRGCGCRGGCAGGVGQTVVKWEGEKVC